MQFILSKDKIQVECNTKSLLNLYCRNAAMSSPVPPRRRGIGTLSHGQCDFVT